jgi:ubiquinone/menaquinone biosynthesis C-methylase UbiE
MLIAILAATAVATAVSTFLLVLAQAPSKVRRDPGREGLQDRQASIAYDGMSATPAFAFSRLLILRALRRWRPDGTLVDLGCGPGYLAVRISKEYPGLTTVGLDVSSDMVDLARANSQRRASVNLRLVLGNVEALPLADGSIDCAVSSLSLHHWSDAQGALREINRVLKPGGRLLIFDARRDSPRLVYFAFVIGQLLSPADIRRTNGAVGSLWASYTARELESLLSGAAFDDVQVASRPGWLQATAVKPAVSPRACPALENEIIS